MSSAYTYNGVDGAPLVACVRLAPYRYTAETWSRGESQVQTWEQVRKDLLPVVQGVRKRKEGPTMKR